MAVFKMFEGLSKKETNHIFDSGLIRPIEEGNVLFRQGDDGDEMYAILTGKIDVVSEQGSQKEIIAELGPGELLGEMAMFEESHERSASAFAKEPSQVLVLSEEILEKLLEKKMPRKFLANIIRILCHRLRDTNSMYMQAKYGDDNF
jgi:CRP-like cAMP-binding protein